MNNFIVIGGGAAGFFAAINCPFPVILLEKTKVPLQKVRISGGGRCNVTHACFDPKKLVQNYPRGNKALLGPFYRFQPKDTVDWFEKRGVLLKTEEDGRMFPITDSSETIIDCLMKEARKNVEIRLESSCERIEKTKEGFRLFVGDQVLETKYLLLASGSSKEGYRLAESLGHSIEPTVPSLFTFNVPDSPLLECAGVSLEKVKVRVGDFEQTGPLLITHWGFSGPASLKLSSFAARFLAEKKYEVTLSIDWIPDVTLEDFFLLKQQHPAQLFTNVSPFHLPKSLWKHFVPMKRLSDVSKQEMEGIYRGLKKATYQVKGKTTYKQEFVTAGGIKLDEVNFQTMESKIVPGLFFSGEILDIDGITGGFNFQNAWTTGWIVSQAVQRSAS
jgi:predicted Rossmann fold flavoprotein